MKKSNLVPWLFVSPFLISLMLFFVYAAIRSVIFSFTDYNLFDKPNFVGFQNYISLFSDANFKFALRNTLVYAVIVTSIQSFLALLLAAILNMKIRGIYFFRAGFYLPSITSSVVITVIFLWLFQRTGFINYIFTILRGELPFIALSFGFTFIFQIVLVYLEKKRGMPAKILELPLLIMSIIISLAIVALLRLTGIIHPGEIDPVNIVWLQTRETFIGVPRPLWAIIIQNIFTTIPTLMLIFLAGLQDVPPPLYEAAKIDGADSIQRFFRITLPGLKPVIFLVLTLSLIGTLQMFDQVAVYGDAVPLQSVITLAYYVYNRMFPGGTLPQVGTASAAALFLAAITIAAVMLQRKVLKSNETE